MTVLISFKLQLDNILGGKPQIYYKKEEVS